jgi:molybdopterin-guanine dinucleotide biosynthesis protein MobB
MVILGIIGPSKSGKTTLIKQLITALNPLSVGVIKHSHHKNIQVQDKGKDTERFRNAGAVFSICFPALKPFPEALSSVGSCDVLLVEGYRNSPIPKLLYAPQEHLDPHWTIPKQINAQVGNHQPHIKVIDDNLGAIKDWVLSFL